MKTWWDVTAHRAGMSSRLNYPSRPTDALIATLRTDVAGSHKATNERCSGLGIRKRENGGHSIQLLSLSDMKALSWSLLRLCGITQLHTINLASSRQWEARTKNGLRTCNPHMSATLSRAKCFHMRYKLTRCTVHVVPTHELST